MKGCEFMDLWQQIQVLMQELDRSLRLAYENGCELAQAEYDYKILLRQKTLILKDEKMPTTLIDKVVLGDEDVAQARRKRDIAEVKYNASKDKINAIKMELKVYNECLNREWNGGGTE